MDADVTGASDLRDVISRAGAAAARPMVWGLDDCTLWVADIVHAWKGVDLAAKYRGRYRTEIGSKRVIRRLDGSHYRAVVRALVRCGARRVSPVMPADGDIGMVENAGRLIPAIHWRGFWLCRGACGIVALQTAIKAWRLP